MALSRKYLKALGLTDEQVDAVVENHSETITSIKEELKTARETANDYETLKAEYEKLKNTHSEMENYKIKYETEHTAFENYKSEIAKKEIKTAKETAVKKYFEEKNITGKNLVIALRGSKAEVDGIEIDGNGNIKDSKALDDLISGDFAGLVSTHETVGIRTATPPSKDGGNVKPKSRAREIAEKYFSDKYGTKPIDKEE